MIRHVTEWTFCKLWHSYCSLTIHECRINAQEKATEFCHRFQGNIPSTFPLCASSSSERLSASSQLAQMRNCRVTCPFQFQKPTDSLIHHYMAFWSLVKSLLLIKSLSPLMKSLQHCQHRLKFLYHTWIIDTAFTAHALCTFCNLQDDKIKIWISSVSSTSGLVIPVSSNHKKLELFVCLSIFWVNCLISGFSLP